MKKLIKKILIYSFLGLVFLLPNSSFAKVNPPTNLVATAGDGKVYISFTPSTVTAGEKIEKYYAYTSGVDKDLISYYYEGWSTKSPIVVKVPNNYNYTFRVYAVASGYSSSADSAKTNLVTPTEGATGLPGGSTGGSDSVTTGGGTMGGTGSSVTTGRMNITIEPIGSSTAHVSGQASGFEPNSSFYLSYVYQGGSIQRKSFTTDGSKNFSFDITGLIPGRYYGYATGNQSGTESYASGSFEMPFKVLSPSAPTNVTVEKGTYGNAILKFTASSPGSTSSGSQIKFYSVKTTPDIGSFSSGASSPLTISGIENGKSYQFEIRAQDNDGFWGPYSKITAPLSFKWESNSLVPGAPTNVTAKPDDMSVVLSFTPPTPASSSEGSKIKFYSVKITPDGRTFASGLSSPIKVVGLESGKSYQFEIRAQDNDGFWGPYSTITKAVKPTGPTTLQPDAPLNVTALAGDKKATVSFTPLTPKTSSNGSKIKFYSIRSTPDIGHFPNNTTSPIVVDGLENGKTYTFTVKAQDNDGFWGPESNISNPVTPVGKPDAPKSVYTKAGDTGVSVYWDVPKNNGGSPITSYTVTLEGGDQALSHKTSKGTSLYVSNLVNGQSYVFGVVATNKYGDSEKTLSQPVVPNGEGISGENDNPLTEEESVPTGISQYFQIKNPLKSNSMEDFIARVLEALVLLMTPILVLAVIASGFLFVKARGNPEELSTAKRILLYTLVGAAIILGAEVIANALEGTLNNF